MFTKTLSKNAAGALALLGELKVFEDAYLAGGTACALQLGHRVSLDLDFFTEKEFNTEIVIKSLKKLPGFKLEDIAAMKIVALGDRGTKRDFVDLYFLAKKFSLE